MNFPSYIPAPVRVLYQRTMSLINDILTNTSDRPPPSTLGFFSKYYSGDHKLPQMGFDDHCFGWIAKHWRYKERIAKKRDLLFRLIHDDRMHEAYAHLHGELSEDESWHRLIWAAMISDIDFQELRSELTTASQLCSEISRTADHLAELLEYQFSVNVDLPTLRSVLLAMAKHLEMTPEEMPLIMSASNLPSFIRFVADEARTASTSIKSNSTLGTLYEWQPSIGFDDAYTNAIYLAAMRTRQSNLKMEYLRAILYGIAGKEPTGLTPALQKAVAIISTVALDQPDLVVTTADVRSIYRKPVKTDPKNSRRKKRTSYTPERRTRAAKMK